MPDKNQLNKVTLLQNGRRELFAVVTPVFYTQSTFCSPSGEYGAFSTIWYDDVTRTAYFEPVGAAPEHQRLGLGKAVMCEGLRRLKRMGATMAFVGSYTPPAHALYASVGFTEYNLSEPWEKEL